MKMRSFLAAAVVSTVLLGSMNSANAYADPRGVGLGVAAGVDLSKGQDVDVKSAFAWGFFVDIPLLDTFYITPSASLYEMDVEGKGKLSLTDVDLNFKFIVPVGSLRFGAGILAGLSTGLGDYLGHFGLLGFGSLNLVSNLDAFVMAQYKRLAYGGENIDKFHGFGGFMFRF